MIAPAFDHKVNKNEVPVFDQKSTVSEIDQKTAFVSFDQKTADAKFDQKDAAAVIGQNEAAADAFTQKGPYWNADVTFSQNRLAR